MWTLYPPVPGKTQKWSVRGVYCGIQLDKKSTGATTQEAAKRILKTWMRLAETGKFAVEPQAEAKTFGRAAAAYMGSPTDEAYKGRSLYLPKILTHWADKLVDHIDQEAIDNLAIELYPDCSPATRNRQVHTPVSCVLKHVLGRHAWEVKRPEGASGIQRKDWLTPEQAFKVIDAAYQIEEQFGVFVELTLYSGCRLSEVLALTFNDLNVREGEGHVVKTKTGKDRWINLTPGVVQALAAHFGLDRLERPSAERLFRYHKGGQFTRMFHQALQTAGVFELLPEGGRGYHLLCHTYATWMGKYLGMSSFDLARTGRWADASSANRYNHVAPTAEARKADQLPSRPIARPAPQLRVVA